MVAKTPSWRSIRHSGIAKTVGAYSFPIRVEKRGRPVHRLTYDEALPSGREPRPDDDEPAGFAVGLGLCGLEDKVALGMG